MSLKNIEIWHGIYDIYLKKSFNFAGFFHPESRTHLLMCEKLKSFLLTKGLKFKDRYGVQQFRFTLGTDSENHIEVISICHPHFNEYIEEIGENIVVGRIKRMRGDVKEIIYMKEEYELQIKLYDIKDKDGKITKTVYKTITRKRPKLNVYGDTIIKKTNYFKLYDLDKRYETEKEDGTIVYGELVYPYIYKRKD